jgi:hypothetical protein
MADVSPTRILISVSLGKIWTWVVLLFLSLKALVRGWVGKLTESIGWGGVSVVSNSHGKIVSFKIGPTPYKLFIPRVVRRALPTSIENQDGEDIYDQMIEYMGPNSDFFHTPATPKMFGHTSISFHYTSGTTQFSENEPLIIRAPTKNAPEKNNQKKYCT